MTRQRFLGSGTRDGPMWVRSRRTTVLNRVTAVCMEEIPASSTRSSHTPGRSAARVTVKKKTRRSFVEVIGCNEVTLSFNELCQW